MGRTAPPPQLLSWHSCIEQLISPAALHIETYIRLCHIRKNVSFEGAFGLPKQPQIVHDVELQRSPAATHSSMTTTRRSQRWTRTNAADAFSSICGLSSRSSSASDSRSSWCCPARPPPRASSEALARSSGNVVLPSSSNLQTWWLRGILAYIGW